MNTEKELDQQLAEAEREIEALPDPVEPFDTWRSFRPLLIGLMCITACFMAVLYLL